MRIFVPRAVFWWREYSLQRPWGPHPAIMPSGDPGSLSVVLASSMPEDQIPVEVEGYWYETHGRRINDVVHSKLVGPEGSAAAPLCGVDGRASYYSPYQIGYTLHTWASSPVDLGTPICRNVPTRFVLNQGAMGYYVVISPPRTRDIQYKIDVSVSITCQFYSGIEGKYFILRRWDKTLKYYFNVHRTNPDPVTRFEYITFTWDGKMPSNRKQFAWLDDNEIAVIATYIEGLTHTARGSLNYYYMPGNEGTMLSALEQIKAYLPKLIRSGMDTNFSGWTKTYASTKTELIVSQLLAPSERFLLHEDEFVAQGLDPYLITRHGLPMYWKNVLVQQSYLNALESVPTMNDNNISNVLEIAGFIKSLVIDHEVKIPKSLGELWLSYRYSYKTTRADAEEAISFMHRYRELGTLDKWIKCYGVSNIDYTVDGETTPIECRCCLSIRPKDVAILAKIWRCLYTYGLQPNFYTLWDMIPYSFIIDWLIPIGTLAHVADAQDMYSGQYYEIRDVCFSLSYDRMDSVGNRYHQYSRWGQDDIPQLNGFYFFEQDPVSTKVTGMRVLDSLSLFIGKR